MNKIATPHDKSLALEGQVINLALYDKHACSLFYDLQENDFLESYNKSIKLIINRMMEEKKAVTPGSVYNEIVGTEFRDYFVSISSNQLVADIDTVFMQFNQYHRMVKMLPMIENLNHSCAIGHPEFDEQFDQVSDFFSTSKVAQDAIRMKDLMKRKPEEIKANQIRFKTGINSLDEFIKYLYGGQYITIAAAPGCIAGDTSIRFHRAGKGFKKSIEDARNSLHHIGRKDAWWDNSIKTYVRSFNGKTIQLHEIDDIIYSGIKIVFNLKLADGKNIKLTPDHKVLTARGWVETKNLMVHDMIMIDSPHPKKILNKYNKKRDKEIYNIPNHPFAIRKFDIRRGSATSRIALHRLVYEADLNNLYLEDYIDCLRNYPEVCKKFEFVDPSIYHIHHKDGYHNNNDIENLIQLTINEHLKLHSEVCRFNFNQGNPSFVEVMSIDHVGAVETYDIICKDPYRNFSANDIIIHNCGKTTLAGIIAENIPDSLMMSYEMSAEEIHDILISRKARVNSENIETDDLTFPERQSIATARRILSDECTLLVCDQNLNMPDMFGFIKRSVRRYGVKCVVIDYAQIIPGIPGKGTQTEKFEMLSRRFKNLARELKIVVIALSQLNKDSIKEGRAPNLSDLRGSLSFGADADKVIFLYTVPDEEVMGRGSTSLSLGKNRKGRLGKVDNFFYQKEIHFMR